MGGVLTGFQPFTVIVPYSVFIIPTSFSHYLRLMIVQPFPSFFPWYYGLQLLAPAADILAVRCYYVSIRIRLLLRICKTSSGKRYHLHLIYLLHLHLEIRAVLDFVLFRKLVRFKYALYTVSVRQTEALPWASFRFHLTMDTLAFG